MKKAWGSLAAVCVLVIGVYAYMAESGVLELASLNAADTYYNLLVQGFRAGQLSLKKEAPPEFSHVADPYDAVANPPYQMLDLSYYKGKLYLYFGITPALMLFWPYVALTGHYLFHRQAVAIFCVMGFLTSVGLLGALWRRYFAGVSVAVVAAGALALGLTTGVPGLLSQSDVYEVPISCGYMLSMLALAAIWCAVHRPEGRCRWLAMASVAYGLAVGARPSLLFGAVILLVPVVQAWHVRRQIGAVLMAAMGPILLIGFGLMLYNARRFGSPFEFGWHYQLGGERQVGRQLFSLRYLWFNFRVYFLGLAHWSARSPFVHGITVPPVPSGYAQVRNPFGVLANVPLVWLALAAPLAWRNRPVEAASALRSFMTAVILLFGTSALTVGLFWSASFRYEVDFLPALVLLAVVGMLGAERGLADRPTWRRAVRWGWGLLLVFSVAFNVLASVAYYAEAHNSLGITLAGEGRQQEAMRQWEQAVQLRPDYIEAHKRMADSLRQSGQLEEAMRHWERVLQIEPDDAEAHNNLGAAFEEAGRTEQAIGHYEEALRIRPDFAEAHYDLGVALMHLGRAQEAMAQWEQALRIKPDFAEAHCNLGNALERAGKIEGAVAHYEQAVRIKPDFVEAQFQMGVDLIRLGRGGEAVGHFKQVLRIKPDYAEAHCDLGMALEQVGKIEEAIGHYEQALRIKPDFAEARNALARLQIGR